MRWVAALPHLKDPATYDCEYCYEKKTLREDRNCGWTKPGECQKCGDVKFEDVDKDRMSSRFLCPTCGKPVRFGKSEFVLGKTYRTPGCPKSNITERAKFLIQLVDWSDTTGRLPTANILLEESSFFFEVRNFILLERMIAEEELRPKEKTSPKG